MTIKNFDLKSQWQMVIAISSVIAIGAYFLLKLIPALNMASQLIKDSPLLLIIIFGGIPLLIKIFREIFKGNFGADLLAAIALITAVLLHETLAAGLIIFMLASGQALENYATKKASSALLALINRMPLKAHLKKGDEIKEINVNEIKISDQIIIYPHEICPVDGLVIEGRSAMDESYLTGEPYKISKIIGSQVLSGAINGENILIIKAEKFASESRYAKIMEVMEAAEQKRPALRRLGDQIGMIFTPFALVIAGAAWYLTGDLMRFLSVLVIATPCPLLIAIPITIISAISVAARKGIIIKDPVILERLPTCRTAIFDKTGTLTYNNPELAEILTAAHIDKNFILQQVASLERYSRHPLSAAILAAADKAKLPFLKVENVAEKPGQGLFGVIDQQEILVTSRKKLTESHADISAQLPQTKVGLEFIVLVNNQYAATFILRDAVRLEGGPLIKHLHPVHKFNRIILLSGDRESEVSYLAKILGITETYSSQSPENKVAIVRDEAKKAPTLFMGDGINDAPALAVATVGVAFGQNSNVTSEAAGAVIMENSLVKLDELIHISESMRRIAAQSAVGGMVLSVIGMVFAAMGYINPVTGALIQEIIDVIAILNALRMTFNTNIETDIKSN